MVTILKSFGKKIVHLFSFMDVPKKSIVFICIGNACRSQMAEGFARHYGQDQFRIFSAGSHPTGWIAPEATQVMAEKGVALTGQWSKSIAALPLQEFDYIITMGCGISCPTLKGKKRIDWEIPDPIGQPPEVFRKVRDEIEEKVGYLLRDIT